MGKTEGLRKHLNLPPPALSEATSWADRSKSWALEEPSPSRIDQAALGPDTALRTPLFYPSSVPHIWIIHKITSPTNLFTLPLIFFLAGSLFNTVALKFPSVHIWKFSSGEERHTALGFVPANSMIVANKIASIHILITHTASNCIGGKVPVQSCLRPVQMALTVFFINQGIDRDRFVTYVLEGKSAFIPSKALTECICFTPISRRD